MEERIARGDFDGCVGEVRVEMSSCYNAWPDTTDGVVFGWTCPQCGMFVRHDEVHECPVKDPATVATAPPVHPWDLSATLELTRVAVAIERIADVLEKWEKRDVWRQRHGR